MPSAGGGGWGRRRRRRGCPSCSYGNPADVREAPSLSSSVVRALDRAEEAAVVAEAEGAEGEQAGWHRRI